MKTVISISEKLFQQADSLAREHKKSRSQVFCDALREYFLRHNPDAITAAMNRTIDEINPPADEFIKTAAWHGLKRNDW